MEWTDIVDTLYLWYNEFIDWYLVQPIYGQILVIVGIIAIMALAVVLVYYTIKGVAYLIYYTLKGISSLLKWIGYGLFKLGEGFYYLVSGETRPKKQTQNDNLITNIEVNNSLLYCSECGNKLSEKMINQMISNKIAYCINCGRSLKAIEYQEPLITAQ